MIAMRPNSVSVWTAVVLASWAMGSPLAAENWSQWRGAAGTGASSETGLPVYWGSAENIAWTAHLSGLGVSSPIVWGDRVFVTSQSGAGRILAGPRLSQGDAAEQALRGMTGATGAEHGAVRFAVEAFARSDGHRVWIHDLSAEGDLPSVHDKHNLASASPVTDGERVYAVFGTGQVVAVDMAGTLVWTRQLGRDFSPFDIQWGNGSSPLLHRGSLILVCYHQSASYVIALDSRTGKQLWKTDRPKGLLSYSTPIVAATPTGDEVIVNSTAGIEGFDAATGAALWHFDEPNQFPVPVGLVDRGVIYLSRGYRSGPYAAFRPGGRGDISKSNVLWHVSTGAPYISSLVYYDGLLYMVGDVGVVACIETKTGERLWQQRIGGVFSASPVAGDGKIYFLSENGETIVMRAGRSPEVLARNKIDGRTLASPAISGGRLFLRTDDALIAIGGRTGS
jgi:outer membrane protein assembly factor BamB